MTFAVLPGETVVLLGANGAGKTTLLRCLLGLLPSQGRVFVGGTDASRRRPEWLRSVGVVPDDPDELLPELTALEHWRLAAVLRGLDKQEQARMLLHAAELARRLQFEPDQKVLASGYSHGMRKKTQLVGALMHRPPLLVVDEPRNGLDPAGIAMMELLLAEHCGSGGGVLAASHDLHWAERIATRVVVLAHGACLAAGPPADLCRPGERLVDAFFRLTGGLLPTQPSPDGSALAEAPARR